MKIVIEKESLRKFGESLVAAFVATAISYVVAFRMGWATEINYLEMFAVFTSYSCTYMCVRETRWNYPMGIITTFAYSILYFQWNLFALAAFNLYLVFSLIYGFIRWENDSNTKPVSRLGFDIWSLGYVGLGVGVWGLLTLSNWYFKGELTVTETWIVVLSGVAQFLLDNKKIENWLVWIVVNVMSIWFYFGTSFSFETYEFAFSMPYPIVGFQYIFFLANTLFGLTMWYRSMKFGTKLVTPHEHANA